MLLHPAKHRAAPTTECLSGPGHQQCRAEKPWVRLVVTGKHSDQREVLQSSYSSLKDTLTHIFPFHWLKYKKPLMASLDKCWPRRFWPSWKSARAQWQGGQLCSRGGVFRQAVSRVLKPGGHACRMHSFSLRKLIGKLKKLTDCISFTSCAQNLVPDIGCFPSYI